MTLMDQPEFLEAVDVTGRILGSLFIAAPDNKGNRDLVTNLISRPLALSWPFGTDEDLDAIYNQMKGAWKPAKTKAGRLALKKEYDRLFDEDSEDVVSAYGSVYLGQKGVVFGPSLKKMRKWMEDNNLKSLYPEDVAEDHVGRMFLMMSFLATQRPELLEDFLQNWFITWAPHYLKRLQESTDNNFYLATARLAQVTLEELKTGLELDIPKKRFYR